MIFVFLAKVGAPRGRDVSKSGTLPEIKYELKPADPFSLWEKARMSVRCAQARLCGRAIAKFLESTENRDSFSVQCAHERNSRTHTIRNSHSPGARVICRFARVLARFAARAGGGRRGVSADGDAYACRSAHRDVNPVAHTRRVPYSRPDAASSLPGNPLGFRAKYGICDWDVREFGEVRARTLDSFRVVTRPSDRGFHSSKFISGTRLGQRRA